MRVEHRLDVVPPWEQTACVQEAESLAQQKLHGFLFNRRVRGALLNAAFGCRVHPEIVGLAASSSE